MTPPDATSRSSGIGLAESGDLSRADALLADRIGLSGEAGRSSPSMTAVETSKLSHSKRALADHDRPAPDNDIVLSWDSEVSRPRPPAAYRGGLGARRRRVPQWVLPER